MGCMCVCARQRQVESCLATRLLEVKSEAVGSCSA